MAASEYSRAYNRAISALARREQSAHELLERLLRHTDQDTAEQVLSNLKQQNLQSDGRYAEIYCRSKFNRGQGPVKIAYHLKQHEITSELIEQHMSAFEHQWHDRLLELRQRKFGDTAPETFPEWAKQARFLQQRGFTQPQISRALRFEDE